MILVLTDIFSPKKPLEYVGKSTDEGRVWVSSI